MRLMRTWISLVLAVGLVVAGVVYSPGLAGRVAYAVAAEQSEAARSELGKLAGHNQLSVLFRAVSKAVKPAVVEVRVTKRLKVEQMPIPWLDDEFFRRFFGDSPYGFRFKTPRGNREYLRRGLGSGVIVDAAEGYILTNYHVVAGADKVEIVLADKRTFQAEWVRTDRQTDLAIVKITPDHLMDARLGDSSKMQVGDWVLAIGTPEAFPQTVTAGIVSAKGRTTGARQMYQNFIQTDAAINHGNSGGPLVNMRGEVIGINTAIVSRTGVNEGIGMAIPSNMARNVMRQLIDKGKVVRGYLGVVIQDVHEGLAKSFGLPDTNGALVAQVAKGGPADEAGIKEGDFIVTVDGKATTNLNELRHAVADVLPGKTVPVEIYRNGEKRTVRVKVRLQPGDMATAFGQTGRSETAIERFGLKVATLTEQLANQHGYGSSMGGVLITEVDPGSDAAEQHLREGMVITRVQGKAVETADDFAEALSAKDAVVGVRLRVVEPSGVRRFVFITPTK